MEIYYTGIGSNKTGKHTENEFLNIMNEQFTHKNWKKMNVDQLQFKDWVLPDDFIFFTLSDWIEYSGAEINLKKNE